MKEEFCFKKKKTKTAVKVLASSLPTTVGQNRFPRNANGGTCLPSRHLFRKEPLSLPLGGAAWDAVLLWRTLLLPQEPFSSYAYSSHSSVPCLLKGPRAWPLHHHLRAV